MAQLLVTGTDAQGHSGSVSIEVVKDGGGEAILTGDIGGVVAAGTVARLRGNCRLIADLHVRGTLVCDPSGVDLNGQSLFDIHTHDGTLNLVGVEKTAWCRWGDVVVGWQIGDRLAVAPTAPGVYVPTEITWQGSWLATPRPANSPDVTLVDGSTARPEVANLSQTVTLRNLKRIMIHEATGPNPQALKWIRVLNCGETGVLAMYPVHFHFLGEHARGSLIEGVVVEGGKNHAFVPHASHGVTLKDCAAVNTIDDPYWWDPPPVGTTDEINFTNDVDYDGCLALHVTHSSAATGARLAGFFLDGGSGNKCNRSAAVAIGGTAGFQNASGFHWPERGGGVWEFLDNVAHNNKIDGIFTWQNSPFLDHVIDGFTAYHCGKAGVEHGAYLNWYHFRNLNLTGNLWGMFNHALSSTLKTLPDARLVFEDVLSSDPLRIANHHQPSNRPTIYRRCTFPRVVYGEQAHNPSWISYEDCGLVPADFDLVNARPESQIDILEGGTLKHRWLAGDWS